MKLGERGAELIKSYEQCRLKAYLPTANDQLTIGWGHCGPEVTEHTVWTQEQADEAFLQDVERFERCVNKAVTVPLTQNEFDALVSLCFNIGCAAFSGSTLVRRLNNSDYDAASEQFARWNRQGAKVLDGLTRRRAAEAELFENTA